MSHGSLEDPAAKLRRAVDHYLAIKESLGGTDHQLLSLKVVSSADRLRFDFFAEQVPPLPPDLPLMLSDAYHNLRGALDHLAYQMHVRRYRGSIPLAVAEVAAFPIRTRTPSTRTDQWSRIKHLGARERRAIAWLQPYRQRKDAFHGAREHLADICEINDIDKHRKLLVPGRFAQAVPIVDSLKSYGLSNAPAFGSLIETGSRVDTWTFEREPPEAKVARDWKFRSGAVFECRGYRIDLVPHLGGSIHAIAQILDRFKYLFPALTPSWDISRVRPEEALW